MHRARWIVAGLLLLALGQAAAEPTNGYFGASPPPKDPSGIRPWMAPPPGTLVGGDVFGNATPVPLLPYTDYGNTCAFNDDYFPSCAYQGISAAPDVVYAYTPQSDVCVDASLCGSTFDTVLHAYEGGSGGLVGCNDDDCGLQSALGGLQLQGGVTYYFVVDGWSTACGDYTFSLSACPAPCVVQCPPNAILEGEPDCGPGYVDSYDGGCNSSPPAYKDLGSVPLGNSLTVCGRYGNYVTGGSSRDTDWYRITVPDEGRPVTLQICATGELPTQLALLEPNCSPITVACGSVFGDPCRDICCEATVAPGEYWVFVAPSVFSGYPCGADYTVTVCSECVIGVEPSSWSRVKHLYR
jgi:hypothetical protein